MKLAIALGLLFFVEGFSCETVAEVVAEFRPIIREIHIKASVTARESGIELGKAKREIGLEKRNATLAINRQIHELKHLVQEAQVEAEASGKDIEACVRNFSVAVCKINLHEINKCNPYEELAAAGRALGELWRLQRQIGWIPEECVGKFPSDEQTSELRVCFVEAVSVVNGEIERLQGVVVESAQIAKENAKDCVAVAAGDVENSLLLIEDDFGKCVEGA